MKILQSVLKKLKITGAGKMTKNVYNELSMLNHVCVIFAKKL